MSELRVDNIVDMGGSGAPKLRKGANVTGISTITQAVVGNATINAGGINATGIVTSSSNKFVGDLASGNITAGVMTATSSVVASNITINSGGVNASGIISATSYQGSGANLTGIGLTIAPLAYNPDVSDTSVTATTGIGLTFNQRVSAGTGNVTLSLVSVGSTVVENFGVGSSVSIDGNTVTINPTNDLSGNTVYAISYPSGAFTQSGAGGSFVGTAYTFVTEKNQYGELWMVGNNQYGLLGQNQPEASDRSSPVQIPGTNWKTLPVGGGDNAYRAAAIKVDGTLWMWGYNGDGELGQNSPTNTHLSSPTQIPGTTWKYVANRGAVHAIKTDGTMWAWGDNSRGQLGQNSEVRYSSPVQIPGTTWSTANKHNITAGSGLVGAVKTDGTLWMWGYNNAGALGLNAPSNANRSSPTQVGSDTTWAAISGYTYGNIATKTDGTLWSWGKNDYGQMGVNDRTQYSSPVQVGSDTTWGNLNAAVSRFGVAAIKTDGTLWQWGRNINGGMGGTGDRSSPTQIPGTTWKEIAIGDDGTRIAVKTDGTMWGWGDNAQGQLGQNEEGNDFNSPVQIPGSSWFSVAARRLANMAIKQV